MSINQVAGTFDSGYWFSISKDGRIRHTENGEEQFFNYLEGCLVDILTKQDTYEGNEIEKIDFIIKADPNGDEKFTLSCGRHTTFTRNILNRLANLDEIGKVRITPYTFEREGSQNLICGALRNEGQKVKGKFTPDDVPKVEPVTANGKVVKQNGRPLLDSEEANKFWDNLIPAIKERLKYKLDAAPVETKDKDDDDTEVEDGEVPF